MHPIFENTFEVLNEIYQKYMETQDAMKSITVHILSNIKTSY